MEKELKIATIILCTLLLCVCIYNIITLYSESNVEEQQEQDFISAIKEVSWYDFVNSFDSLGFILEKTNYTNYSNINKTGFYYTEIDLRFCKPECRFDSYEERCCK